MGLIGDRNIFEWFGDEVISPVTDAIGLTDSSSGNREDQQRAEAQAIWDDVGQGTPGVDDLYQPYEYDYFTPYETEWRQGVDVDADREAQMRALSQMQQVASGGLTDADRMALQESQTRAAAAEQSQRAAIQQQAQMRGVGGSGLSYAAQLAAQQGAANRGRSDATQIANAAQQRALQAMQASGQQSMQMGAQQYQQQAGRASAIDRFNEANTQRRDAVRQSNADRRGEAVQQAHDNRVQIAAGRTGQLNYNADATARRSQQQQAQTAGLLGAIL